MFPADKVQITVGEVLRRKLTDIIRIMGIRRSNVPEIFQVQCLSDTFGATAVKHQNVIEKIDILC